MDLPRPLGKRLLSACCLLLVLAASPARSQVPEAYLEATAAAQAHAASPAGWVAHGVSFGVEAQW